MKNILDLRGMLKIICTGVLIMGLLTSSFGLPKKTYYAKLDKNKRIFKTPTVDFAGGKIVVSGIVKGVEVSGGSDGCYTFTVTTYRFAPNGEKIPVRSISKPVCVDITKLPEVVIDRVPRGKYLIEIEVDRPRDFGEAKFEAEINVLYGS